MNDVADDDRRRGMGIVVAYAGQRVRAQWIAPRPARWDYMRFGASLPAITPDETIEMTIIKRNATLNGFNQWTLNGKPFQWRHRGRAISCDRGGVTACGSATPAPTSIRCTCTATASN